VTVRRPELHGRPLEALCLDLDDTILDGAGSVRAAYDHLADTIRRRYPALARGDVLAAIESTTGAFWADEDRHRRGRLDLEAARREIVGAILTALGHPDPDLTRVAAEAYTAFRQRELRLFEGAIETLERLRAAIPRLALVTNGAAAPQRDKIERFGLAKFFDHIQVEGEFGAGKPDAAVYLHVLDRLGADPGASLMVGDNFACDVVGALEVGMHAAWIDPSGSNSPPARVSRPHWVLRRLAELPPKFGL
jgi:putative hydrolase of the HAD superfamily